MLPHEGVQIVATGGPANDGTAAGAAGAAAAVVEAATARPAASAIVPEKILTRFMGIPDSSR